MRHVEYYNFHRIRCKKLKNFGEVKVIPELLNVFKFSLHPKVKEVQDLEVILTDIEKISDVEEVKSFKPYKKGYILGHGFSSKEVKGVPNSALGLRTLRHPSMFYK